MCRGREKLPVSSTSRGVGRKATTPGKVPPKGRPKEKQQLRSLALQQHNSRAMAATGHHQRGTKEPPVGAAEAVGAGERCHHLNLTALGSFLPCQELHK